MQMRSHDYSAVEISHVLRITNLGSQLITSIEPTAKNELANLNFNLMSTDCSWLT